MRTFPNLLYQVTSSFQRASSAFIIAAGVSAWQMAPESSRRVNRCDEGASRATFSVHRNRTKTVSGKHGYPVTYCNATSLPCWSLYGATFESCVHSLGVARPGTRHTITSTAFQGFHNVWVQKIPAAEPSLRRSLSLSRLRNTPFLWSPKVCSRGHKSPSIRPYIEQI